MRKPSDWTKDVDDLVKGGDLSRARTRIAEHLREQPSDTRAQLMLGDLGVAAGMNAEAVGAYMVAAQRYIEDGDRLRAIAVLNQILRIEPGHSLARQALAALNKDTTPP